MSKMGEPNITEYAHYDQVKISKQVPEIVATVTERNSKLPFL